MLLEDLYRTLSLSYILTTQRSLFKILKLKTYTADQWSLEQFKAMSQFQIHLSGILLIEKDSNFSFLMLDLTQIYS